MKNFFRHNCLVVTDETDDCIFVGTRQECQDFMHNNNGWKDLRYAWKENGIIELLRLSSFE